MKNKYWLMTLFCASMTFASSAIAQEKTEDETPPPKEVSEKDTTKKDAKTKKDGKDKKEEKEKSKDEKKPEASDLNATSKEENKVEKAPEREVPAEKAPTVEAAPPIKAQPKISPIAELADKEFVPLEEIEEEELEQIIPAKVHPRVDWSGSFRVRTGVLKNFDLDTNGSSRILPPVEAYAPIGNPAQADKDTHWTTNINLRIDPTIFITEDIKIHSELSFLNNLIMGSLPVAGNTDNPLQNTAAPAGQFSGRSQEFFKNAIEINELYGEVDTIFATLYAGRMDDDWGLGMFAQSGDCQDCNYGNHVDRFKLQTRVFDAYLVGTWDFPSEGLNSSSPAMHGGQAYDLAQIDDAAQWTLSFEKKAKTREELEMKSSALLDEKAWIPEGGIQYRYQSQEGSFVPSTLDKAFDPAAPEALIYKGASAHIIDGWGSLVYQPEYDRFIKINLEVLAAFGNVDNNTQSTVGTVRTNSESALNCFDPSVRDANPTRCTTDESGNSTEESLLQFGVAFESEFRLNSPVIFGLNGGFASGGDTPAWGTQGDRPDLNFFRFNPDYHVDLILFREIIGTVTNAYYVNPHLELQFFESAGRHLELGVDGVFSGVINDQGGVSSGKALGFELDTSLSFVMRDLFTATIEGGILFPFSGLNAEAGRSRYKVFGSNPNEFTQSIKATIPWTIQAKLFWDF